MAAAWAITAGWMRTVGQVTPVATRCPVEAAMAPMTLQTNGLSPCRLVQGWKWSEMNTDRNPAASAIWAWATRSPGPCSSLDRKNPISAMSSLVRAGARCRGATYPKPTTGNGGAPHPTRYRSADAGRNAMP